MFWLSEVYVYYYVVYIEKGYKWYGSDGSGDYSECCCTDIIINCKITYVESV